MTARLPAIVSDLDGVVIKGHSPAIGGAKAVLQKLLKVNKTTKKKVPILFLTNGGGKTEREKAKQLDK